MTADSGAVLLVYIQAPCTAPCGQQIREATNWRIQLAFPA